MAAVLSAAPAHSRHLLPHAHSNAHASAFHGDGHPHTHNAFEAFAPHHHSSIAEASSSWRNHDTLQVPKPFRASSSRSSSHSRSSSSDSTGSWRARSRSPAPVPIVHASAVPAVKASPNAGPVYSVADMLALSVSPLVGIDASAKAALDAFVAHDVWRRGPHTSSSSRTRSRGNRRSWSKPHESTDGEHSE